MDDNITVRQEAKKVFDEIKRNGEFDKCRREVLSKVINSGSMKTSIEECKKIVTRALESSPNVGIAQLRETVKAGIRQHNLIGPLYVCTEKVFREYESGSKLNELIEDISRSQMGAPPRDSNIELVDMEVSSGGSRSSAVSIRTCSSSLSNEAANVAAITDQETPSKADDVANERTPDSLCSEPVPCPPSSSFEPVDETVMADPEFLEEITSPEQLPSLKRQLDDDGPESPKDAEEEEEEAAEEEGFEHTENNWKRRKV